ncbi:ABC transporter substrate-binding protein [Haloterrigena alkaliphila]|uniref:ABC transporter substrate-binding protein n=1 Tax=Haloterrigena alkaliphila TaxID=2816475 RepID=A0A8A2VBD8_9EURY|nr:ABC transporter substrate-binding protein [Haloterrigena alkaliphila]QSW98030.1 ABC transporter substrate-binding protein [Haloterrigena alkaliphila]
MPGTGDSDSTQLPRRPVLEGVGALGIAGLAGCISTGGDVDVDGEAEELIYEGFKEEGVEPPVETTIYANSETEARVRWAQLVQNELDSTDLFDVSFRQIAFTEYLDLVNSMAAEEENALICLGLVGGWDPHSYVYPAFHSDNFAPNGLNISHFENEAVDRLIEDGVRESDTDERVEIYEELQELLVEASPFSFVRSHEEIVVYRADAIDGFRTYPITGDEYTSIYAPTLGVYTELTTGEDELIGDVGTGISSYDPTTINDDTSGMVTGLIYESLLEVDFDGSVRPSLATDWRRIDETTYRFDLREGVTFHTGDEFTAEDVRTTFERYEETPREHDVYDWYDGMEILDDYRIEVSLTRPYGPLETILSGVPIVPSAVADGSVDLSQRPVGTGPYRFVEHQEGRLWRMEANDSHWYDGSGDVPETPPIETITLRIIPEGSSRRAALETGETHLTIGLPNGSLEAYEADDEYVVDRTLSGGVDFLGFPCYLEPFTNRKVRRGIGMLVPRDRIVEDVFHGAGSPAYTPIPPLLEQFVDPEFEAHIVDEYLN